MPNIEIQLPAGIGDEVLIRSEVYVEQVGMVLAWRLERPRFLVGGALDGAPHLFLLVLTEAGEELWLGEAEVRGGAPARVSVFLPFTGGDTVLVSPHRTPGEVRSWKVTGRQLTTTVRYRVHLLNTPTGNEIEVDAHNLVPRLRLAPPGAR